MWLWKMRQCGCQKNYTNFEFPIIDSCGNISIVNNNDIENNYQPTLDELCELKRKIICDFQDIMNKLECGIQPDLEFLLQEISLIYIYDDDTTLFK